MARLVFMGSPAFAVPTLEALAREHELLAVFAQPDKPAGRGRRLTRVPVATWADEHGVPVHQPHSLRKDASAIETLRALRPEVVVVVAYIAEQNSVAEAPHLRPEHRAVFDTAMGDQPIHYMGHVRMIAAAQPFIFELLLWLLVGMLALHVYGAIRREQPMTETIEIALWIVLILATLAFLPKG